ncbi:MAG: 16S rRNA (guanine(966)-N(2))-methyltransferase RsmD [Actinobacteria bacterium]|nr:16S rRNA (guanine(966)-N(2))-methyltransferase RsmD [Actinomycetota bacterium]MDI6831300.1 16S rRNA (guanine(966)-N(2))-methyltransferase RsmD [Actinomycetota bacterium]
MRIIAGDARGRRIKAPRGCGTRPMRDFVREAVFSMLGERVTGAAVLDLFAGSGSLGLEALSRGAAEAVFVDRGGEPCRIIQENLDMLGMSGRGTVVRAEILDYLRKTAGRRSPFHLIFIDPPYRIDLRYRQEMLKRLAAGGFLAPSAVVVIEAPLRSAPPAPPPGMRHRERRKYGETAVDVYVKEENVVKPEREGSSEP